MARLPVPGQDNGTWGDVLNEFLGIEHNADGTLKSSGSLAGKVDATRSIIAGTGLTGGGNLSADRTLSVTDDSTTQKIEIAKAGTLIGTRKRINFIEGTNVVITAADNSGSNRTDITIGASNTAATVTSDQASTSSTLADITGLGLSVGIGSYNFNFLIPYTGSVSSGSGIIVQLNGPASSFISYSIEIQSSINTQGMWHRTVFGSQQNGNVVTTGGSVYLVNIAGRVTTTAGGILQPQFAITNASTTTTVKAGAYGTLQAF